MSLGFIGVSTSGQSRYAEFWDSLIHLDCKYEIRVEIARGSNIAENRNGLTQRALDAGAEWVFYVDDDQIFPPETLHRLLDLNKPIVSGLYVQRQFPFRAHVYNTKDENGFQAPRPLTTNDSGPLGNLLSTGAGALLVRREVLDALSPPYWTLGQLDQVSWSDDFEFLRKAREKGFEVVCDTDCVVGHKVEGTLWPEKTPNGWVTTLVIDNVPVAHFPQPQSELSLEFVRRLQAKEGK